MAVSSPTKIAEYANAGTNVSTTGAIALTSAVAVDSVIVLAVVCGNQSRVFTPSSSAGLTWTRVVTPWPETTASTTVTVALYYAVVTSALTTSDTITVAQDQTSVLGMVAFAYTGVDTAAPIADFSSGANTTTVATLTLPSLDAVTDGSVIVVFGGGGLVGLPVSSSVPSTRVHGTNPTGASSNRLLNIAVDTSGAAATITPSLTLASGSQRQAGIAIALAPAAPPAVTGTLVTDTPSVSITVPTVSWSGSTSGASFTGTLSATTPTVTVAVPSAAWLGAVTGPPAGSVMWMWTGAPTDDSAVVHGRMSGGTSCRLAVSTSSSMTSPTYVAAETPDGYGIVRFQVTGLSDDTRYYFQIEDTPSGGAPELVGAIGTIHTLATAGTIVATRKVSLGSCIATNAAETLALDAAVDWAPHWGAMLGDFFYNANNETNEATWVGKYNSQIANVGAGMQAWLASGAAAYELVSDHDSTNTDNGDSNSAWAPYELAGWRKVVPHQSGSGDSETRDQQWDDGRLSFFLTDIRHVNRTPGATTDGSSKTMLGAAQKARLLDWLDTNPAPFKVIITDTNWMGTASLTKPDIWPAYANERQQIIDAIAAQSTHVEVWHGDSHLLGYATPEDNTWGGFPVICASPYYQDGGGTNFSTFTDYFNNGGAWAQEYGQITFTDDGSTITRQFDGYDALTDTIAISYTTTVDTTVTGTMVVTAPTVTVSAPAVAWVGTATVPMFTAALTADAPSVAVAVPTSAWAGTSVVPEFAGSVLADTPAVSVSVPVAAWVGTVSAPGAFVGAIDAVAPVVSVEVPTVAWAGSVTEPSAEAVLEALTPTVTIAAPTVEWSGTGTPPVFTATLAATTPIVTIQPPAAAWSGASTVPMYAATLNVMLPLITVLVPLWEQSEGEPVSFPDVGTLVLTGPSRTLGLNGPVRTLEWS